MTAFANGNPPLSQISSLKVLSREPDDPVDILAIASSTFIDLT